MLYCLWGSDFRSLFIRSIGACLAWFVLEMLCVLSNAWWTTNVLYSRRSNLLQGRLYEVSFWWMLQHLSLKTCCIRLSENRSSSHRVMNSTKFWQTHSKLFLTIASDLHSAQSVSERSHQLTGYVVQSNMFSIWPVFHVTRAIVNCRRVKSLHWSKIRFFAVNIIWKQLKAKPHQVTVSQVRQFSLQCAVKLNRKKNVHA